MNPDPDWKPHAVKAGSAVLRRREALGYKTRGQFADDTNLTIKTLGQIERGVRPSYNKSTYATIDRVLEWEPGTFESLLTGAVAEQPRAEKTFKRFRRRTPVTDEVLTSGSGSNGPAAEPADVAAEIMTASGVFAHIYAEKMDLAHLIASSDLDAEQRFAIIREHRRRQNEFTRAEEQRIAAEIAKVVDGGSP